MKITLTFGAIANSVQLDLGIARTPTAQKIVDFAAKPNDLFVDPLTLREAQFVLDHLGDFVEPRS